MKKSSENKKITIIIACRNEADIISDCLDSVTGQNYPHDLTEIFVIDGMSDDGTEKIVKEYEKKHSNLRLLKNPGIIQPHAFNMGIKNSTGEYILIMGAHNKYPSDYVTKCIRYALKYKTDNVGGRIRAKTEKKGIIPESIIGTFTSPFGIGNATFRTKTKEPVEVDTVFGGCYRRDVFERIGYYNESLKRSQDMELNLRLRRASGKILLVPDIVSYYYPKTDFVDFIKYNFRAGKGPIRAMRITGKPLKPMHYVPALFVAGIIGGAVLSLFYPNRLLVQIFLAVISLYLILDLYFSFKYAKGQNKWPLIFVLPFIFFFKHFFYGLGSLYGIVKLND